MVVVQLSNREASGMFDRSFGQQTNWPFGYSTTFVGKTVKVRSADIDFSEPSTMPLRTAKSWALR
jgi:hypothetical protein